LKDAGKDMATDTYALKKEMLQTRAAAERLELRALTGRLRPGAARGARLHRYARLAKALRGNPVFVALAGALLARLPLGRFLGVGSKLAALAWGGWQLVNTIKDFQRK
jgi:hypothetical protein